MKRCFAFLLVMVLSLAACQGKDEFALSNEEMMEDWEYLSTALEENYPFFEVAKRVRHCDWLSSVDSHGLKIKKCANAEEFYFALQDVLHPVAGIGHLSLIDPMYYQYLAAGYAMVELEPWTSNLLSVADKYSFWGELLYGQEYLQFNPDLEAVPDEFALDDNVVCNILVDEYIAYLQVKTFSYGNVADDKDIIHDFYHSIAGYPYLIIDIRGNSGGTDLYWAENLVAPIVSSELSFSTYSAYKGGSLVEAYLDNYSIGLELDDAEEERIKLSFSQLPQDLSYPPEIPSEFLYYTESKKTVTPADTHSFAGDVYLLVDESNYSSAESFAMFCKDTGWATLVGETTGGDGGGMDPVLLFLPNSGIAIRFSGAMSLNPDGTCSEEAGTIPDIIIDKGEDALDKVLELIGNF